MNTRKLSPAMIRAIQRLDAHGTTYGASVVALERRGFVEMEIRGIYVIYKITDAGRAALREIASC